MALSGFSTSNYVNLGATATQYRITGNMTVCTWIKFSGFGPSAAQHIFSKWGNAPARCYNLAVSSAGAFAFEISTNGTASVYGRYAGPMSTNTLYHLAGRYNGTLVEVFLNGSQIGTTASYTGSIYNVTAQPLMIGVANLSGSISSPIQGWVEDMRIYSAALSNAQIAAIYAAKGRDGIASNLVWRGAIADGCVGLGSLSGKKVYDHSTYRNHVTATGAPNAIVDQYDPFPTEDA